MLANRSMPACAVIPELAYDDVVEAIQWLREAFGLTERWRAGSHRAQLAIGDGAVALTEHRGGPVSHSVLVRVEAADSHYEHARQHGARILQPPTDCPYGERQYTAEDLAGHRWSFSQSIADVAPEDWGGTSSIST